VLYGGAAHSDLHDWIHFCTHGEELISECMLHIKDTFT
jgi:hypothetical protein